MYKSFKEMPVWIEAMEIAGEIFEVSNGFPRKEDYGLTSQLRRAALSVSGNIAEGYGRKHTRDKMYFYVVSRGSATETQSHLEYAQRVGYVSKESQLMIDKRLANLIHELNKIILTLQRHSQPQPQP